MSNRLDSPHRYLGIQKENNAFYLNTFAESVKVGPLN